MKKLLLISLLIASNLLFAQNNLNENTIMSKEIISSNQTNKSENLIFTYTNNQNMLKTISNDSTNLLINYIIDFNKETNETKMILSVKNLTTEKVNISDLSLKINSTKMNIDKPNSLNPNAEFKSDMKFSLKENITNTIEVSVKYN